MQIDNRDFQKLVLEFMASALRGNGMLGIGLPKDWTERAESMLKAVQKEED